MVPEWAWVGWIATTLAAFAVLEAVALLNGRDGDTLSERARAWLGITPDHPRRRILVPAFIAALAGFTLWLGPHIVLSIW